MPANVCVPGAPPPTPAAKMCPTTSMVDVPDCEQHSSASEGGANLDFEISASGAYMSAQCAMPFASPGHLRGLTVQRLFKKVLAKKPPHLFMSSFNEHFGGRQAAASNCNTGINMGLPFNAQNRTVWVDTYASEFSRDMEPTVEGGDRLWRVVSSCVKMYKAGKACGDVGTAAELCCTTADKEVFANVYSLRSVDGTAADGAADDAMLSSNHSEFASLLASGKFVEVCNPINGSTAFCTNTSMADTRDGPFMVYSERVDDSSLRQGGAVRQLLRCVDTSSGKHFSSVNAACEGGAVDGVLGYIATKRGGETLRALRRCKSRDSAGRRMHALDLLCDAPDSDGEVLGFVR